MHELLNRVKSKDSPLRLRPLAKKLANENGIPYDSKENKTQVWAEIGKRLETFLCDLQGTANDQGIQGELLEARANTCRLEAELQALKAQLNTGSTAAPQKKMNIDELLATFERNGKTRQFQCSSFTTCTKPSLEKEIRELGLSDAQSKKAKSLAEQVHKRLEGRGAQVEKETLQQRTASLSPHNVMLFLPPPLLA